MRIWVDPSPGACGSASFWIRIRNSWQKVKMLTHAREWDGRIGGGRLQGVIGLRSGQSCALKGQSQEER